MKLLKQGAEAKIFLGEYLGEKTVFKQRERKTYRDQELDTKILRERTRNECSLVAKAQKAGIKTPLIRKISLSDFTIVFGLVEGETAKEAISRSPGKGGKICFRIGKEIAKMHSAGIVHGDLTTSNIVLNHGSPVFLDFGLGEVSTKTEDFATDLLAFRKMFKATHFKSLSAWKALEKSYKENFSRGGEVLRQIGKIEGRARYS